mmetsp:Transcript_19736/g.28117  ORF Transcript_19736/g.28117 Transcript_19736/m.28117 type:complete len:588 (-) Transcript_19736:1852-3615(-)
MGNSPSRSASNGTLSIVLDSPQTPNSNFLAGKTLSGSVYAKATSNINSVRIEAYITGKERTRVRYTETSTYRDGNGNTHTRHHTRYRNAERSICRVNINLGEVENVQAGAQHRFPFRIELPHDLPSSMHMQRNGGYCKIDYKFKAHVGGHHKVEQLFNVMSAPLSMQPVANLIRPIMKDVQSCCFRRGTITLGARIANTRIGRGETAIVDFACKNQSRQKITSVAVEIKQEVRWNAGHHKEYAKNVLSTKFFKRTERWGEMSKEEVKAHEQSWRKNTDTHRDRKQQALQMIHKAIFDGENRVLLNVPTAAFQTYEGALVRVSHRMKIKVTFDGTCVDNPTFFVPLYLGTPTSYGSQITSAPPSIPVATAVAVPSAPTMSVEPSAPPLFSEAEIDMAAPSAPPAEWAAAVTSAQVVVGQSVAVVGGNANDYDGEGGAVVQASAVLPVAEVVPSLGNLINEIKFAVSPSDTVRKRLNDKKWAPVFSAMTPIQYSSAIKAVAIEFDQPDIAALIAPSVRGGKFTHEYVIAAIRVVPDWLRTPTISKLLPLCKDLHANVGKIKAELTDWEKVCTQRDFEQAMAIGGQESLA